MCIVQGELKRSALASLEVLFRATPTSVSPKTMDPVTALGVAAAGAQFAGQIINITLSIAKFYSDLKEVPEVVRKQLVHVNQLAGISRLIIQNTGLQTKSIESVLRTSMHVISKIEQELIKVLGDSNDRKLQKIRNSVLAVMKKETFAKLFEDLEREKVSLILCIQEIDS